MKYLTNDSFWDLETTDQIFMNAMYYPESNRVVYYYLDDIDFIDVSHPIVHALITQAFHKFYKHHEFINKETKVEFHNLKTNPGAIQFIKTFGVTLNRGNTKAYKNFLAKMAGTNDASWALTVKETDKKYDPLLHGKLFGYNSTNYDESMLAMIFDFLITTGAAMGETRNTTKDDNPAYFSFKCMTAEYIRQHLNDKLFKNIDNMTRTADNDAPLVGKSTRQGYRNSNRFIDVARLNEKMTKIGLKRIMSYLGLTIKEFDFDPSKKLKTLGDVINLFIYNASDVINLRHVLEHKAYSVPYDLHSQLLERYPQVIYNAKKGSIIEPDISPESVRWARLNLDGTSAKFVEKIVAPYNQLKDDESVNFLYPSTEAIERIYEETGVRVTQFDVLESTRKFFESRVTNDPDHPAHKAFMDVYNFFDHIRGSNFNEGSKYLEDYPSHQNPNADGTLNPDEMRSDGKGRFNKTKHDIHELLDRYNTNLVYFDKDANPTSGYGTFMLGGIHGAEYHKALYDYDLAVYNTYNNALQAIQAKYPKITDLIIPSAKRNSFDKTAQVTLSDGTELNAADIKKYIKNLRITPKPEQLEKLGDDAYGEWKVKPKPELWNRKKRDKSPFFKYELKKRYAYVSAGVANHEDFASYYPLLLSQTSAFLNYARTDENGKPVDTYYSLYQTRLIEKNRSKDKTLSEEIRILANITQNLMKLLINAASGVGDSGFDNNLRVNNKIIKMRIIGQLFAWTIGQAQALEGARVVSTNTDGLYTMDITAEDNDRVLFDTVKTMYIDIEPERIINFVSKDTNNRMENHHGGVTVANGGTLTAWEGPAPTNNLAHPAISDRILAEYLNEEPDAPNHHFNREKANQLIHKFIDERKDSAEGRFEISKFFQWVVSSSDSSRRYIFLDAITTDGKRIIEEQQHYNRMFMVKESYIRDVLGLESIITRSTSKQASKPKPDNDTATAIKIHKAHNFDAASIGEYSTVIKISGLDDAVNTIIDNTSLEYAMSINKYGPYGADFVNDVLDIDAYVDYIERAFESSWYNLQPDEF